MDHRTGEGRPSTAGRPLGGIVALVGAKGLDVASTLYGLRSAGLVELNPVAAGAMDALGTAPGLVALAGVTVLVAVAVTETAARRYGDAVLGPSRLRWLGYAPHVVASLAAALNNLLLAGLV